MGIVRLGGADARARLLKRALRGAFYAALFAATWLLLLPAERLPAEPAFPLADKLGHAALFASLALLGRAAYREQPWWGVAVALALYGGAIEWAQRGVPGRSAEGLDVVADIAGALAARLVPRR